MPRIEHPFFESTLVMQRLASNPLPNTSNEYIDRSLTILGTKTEELSNSTLTKDAFDAAQDVQDKGVRREFKQQRIFMERRFDEVNQRFAEVHQRFADVDQRFADVDQRFGQVDQRFGEVGQRFDKLDDRMDKFDERLSQIEAREYNASLRSSWQSIQPVGVFDPLADPGDRFRMPEYFPNKVIKFWHLQRPRHREYSAA
ncbi:MAG: hypothetical protein M1817_005988 [Caeruleum heppii]|nr:MAG: hypothetical protein M1817_005988 [Caeruleum heppii]